MNSNADDPVEYSPLKQVSIPSSPAPSPSQSLTLLYAKVIPCASGSELEKLTVLGTNGNEEEHAVITHAHASTATRTAGLNIPRAAAHVLLPGVAARLASSTSVLLATCGTNKHTRYQICPQSKPQPNK